MRPRQEERRRQIAQPELQEPRQAGAGKASSRGAPRLQDASPGLLGVLTPSRGPGTLMGSGLMPRGARPHLDRSAQGGGRRAMPPCLAAEECPPALGCGLQVWVGGGSELCPGEGCRCSSTPRREPLRTSQDQKDTSDAREKPGASHPRLPEARAFDEPVGWPCPPASGLPQLLLPGSWLMFPLQVLSTSDTQIHLPDSPRPTRLGTGPVCLPGSALSQLLLGRRQTPSGRRQRPGLGIMGGSLNTYECPPSDHAGADDQGNKATDRFWIFV